MKTIGGLPAIAPAGSLAAIASKFGIKHGRFEAGRRCRGDGMGYNLGFSDMAFA